MRRRTRLIAVLLTAAAAGAGLAVLVAATASAFPENCGSPSGDTVSCSGSATDSFPSSDVCQPGTAEYWEDSDLPATAQSPKLTAVAITPSPCSGATVSQVSVEQWPASTTDPNGTTVTPKPGKAIFRFTWSVTVPNDSTPTGPMNVSWSIAWTEPASSTTTATTGTTTPAQCQVSAVADARPAAVERCADLAVTQLAIGYVIHLGSEVYGYERTAPLPGAKNGYVLTEGEPGLIFFRVNNYGPYPAHCKLELRSSTTGKAFEIPCGYRAGADPVNPRDHFSNSKSFTPPGTRTGTRYDLEAVVSATDAVDPNPTNNSKSAVFIVYGSSAEKPKIGSATSGGASGTVQGAGKAEDRPLTSGRARRPVLKRIQVAILNVSVAGTCSWAQPSGGFTPQRSSTLCDAPVWLTAHGTSHWSLRLARGLPRGRYAFFARAVDSAGNISWPFSAGSQSQASLTVH